MKIILLLVTLCAVPVIFHGQSAQKTDSIVKLLSTAKEDSSKVLLYIALANEYESTDAEKAKLYYRQAGGLSKTINYDNGHYKQLIGMGSVYLVHGNYDSSLYYQEQSLAVAQKMKDSLSIGIALFNIGICYREKSDYTKAIDYCLQGRKIIEAKGQKGIELQVDDALQILYFNRSEYDKAIVFGEKAVALSRELHMNDFLSKCLINLTLSYVEKKMYDKGNAALEEAFSIASALGDIRMQATILQNRAEFAIRRNDYPLTLQYTTQSLALCRQIGSVDGEALSLRALAICYLQMGKHDKAMDYGQQALQIDRNNGYKREEAAVLRVMSSIAYASGHSEKGYQYDDQSIKIIEAMIKDVLSQQSSELEKKYETGQKEIRIQQLEAEKKLHTTLIRQKNIINYSLLAGAATLLIIGLLLYRNYGQKQTLQQQRITELETEKQLTATEAVLKGEEQERTRLAKDLHDGLGGMLSGIKYSMNTMKGNSIMTPENQQAFERSMDMLDSSIQEMRRVAHNMMPEALVKFGLDTALKDFCNDINQSGALKVNYQSIGMEQVTIDQTTSIAIYRIVQELVNNSIKHAAAKTAIVQLTKTNGLLSVTVEDDGKGFDTSILQQSKGIGWSNIRHRVEFLKGKLDVNAAADKGTSVLIEINT